MSSSNVIGLAPRACEVCHRKDRLLRCSGCQVVYYCERDHQAADRDRHKKGCMKVKKARVHLEREEQALRAMPGDFTIPDNVFETGVGRFWGIHPTRPYMRARYGWWMPYFNTLTALDHLLDMLRLCRGDNMGLRQLIPAIYIRLNRDQEAYDFMKWYATAGGESDYDWGDMDLPFLDVKNADVLESPKGMWSNASWLELSHASSVVLVKVRALIDMQAIQNARRAFCGAVPQEIIDCVCDDLISGVLEPHRKILMGGTDEINRLIKTTKRQIRKMYRTISLYNIHFFHFMLSDPEAAIAARPEAYSPTTQEEACLILGYTFRAWAETPGAIDLIETLKES